MRRNKFYVLYIILLILCNQEATFAGEVNRASNRGGNTPVIVRGKKYDYAPSIIYENGLYKMWWCGFDVTDGKGGDHIMYSESSNLATGWSPPRAVFRPNFEFGEFFDSAHTCDPSVVRVGGKYFLYYTGYPTDQELDGGTVNITKIGVAWSNNGIKWKILNNHQPIITPSFSPERAGNDKYGAGHPSVIALKGFFYMTYTDTTGKDPNAQYLIRSPDPTFQTQLQEYNGSRWVKLPNGSKPSGNYPVFLSAKNVDWVYVRDLDQFAVAINGKVGKVSLRFYDVEHPHIQIGNQVNLSGTWQDGPGIVSHPNGHAIMKNNCRTASFDIMRGFCNGNSYQCRPCNIPQETLGECQDRLSPYWDISWLGWDDATGLPGCQDVPYDYDGDHISDPVVFRPSNHTFYVKKSMEGNATHRLGNAFSTPVHGDFDGDGRIDVGVVTPNGSYLDWTIKLSEGGTLFQPTWGVTSDQLAVGDFDGDRKSDIAVFRESNSRWYIIRSSDGKQVSVRWGTPGQSDVAVPADHDGDGIDDLTIYRRNTNTYWSQYSGGGTKVQQWSSHAIPIPGEYFQDGRADFGLWRWKNRKFYIKSVATGSYHGQYWGLTGDVPTLFGDFNGDGHNDLTVWRPSEGNWYHNLRSASGQVSTKVTQWGLPGDIIPTNRLNW